ncbi:hypothetical protein BDW22DRAFT_1077777 [Trametopsis cervina]|nr:hypothetical protein BDW22DRAFT_1077777 [Trametopsis cervina]
MDKTKSKLAAFFNDDEDEPAFPQKAVDEQKLSQYAQGTLRKSKREKEKEAAEAKRKEEEENAAKAYAEFLDAFQGEGIDRKRAGATFVRPGQDSVYTPSVRKAESSHKAQMFQEPSAPPSPPSVVSKPKGKRAMDSFLEEIKREQATRENKFGRHATHGRSITSMAAYEGQSGSRDRGDPETSNIFVANLPPNVTEQSLGMFFARIGPVGSVKIMWPRGDASNTGPASDMNSRRTKSTGLSGFVAFMKRKDAEDALRELDGFDWGGSILRVGWSKAVPVAARPLYVVKKSRLDSRSRSRSRSPIHSPRRHYNDNDRSRSPRRNQAYPDERGSSKHSRLRSASYSRSRSRSSSPSRRYHKGSYGRSARTRSASPAEDEEQTSESFVRTVAAEVRGHGDEYEKSLKERESSNPQYAFFKYGNRRHRLFQSLMRQRNPVDPEFDDEGYNSIYSTDSAEESERERVRKNKLGKLAKKRFESMLRAMSGRRGELARCMAFCLEHAEASSEVADIIIASLLVDGTPVPRKVARLHLICDILHNSAAPLPMAWKFRQEFQTRLGIVFDHLSTIYHSFPGRITAETFKKQITSVIDVWEDWIVFPPEYTAELRSRLEGMKKPDEIEHETHEAESATPEKDSPAVFASKFKASSFMPASAPAVGDGDDGEPMDEGTDDDDNDIDGAPIDNIDGEPVDDVDGEPLAADVDGEPMDDVDGAPLDDIDGAPLDDVDGAPLDDLDGDPMEDDVDGTPV